MFSPYNPYNSPVVEGFFFDIPVSKIQFASGHRISLTHIFPRSLNHSKMTSIFQPSKYFQCKSESD